jgi:hypothetical protein
MLHTCEPWPDEMMGFLTTHFGKPEHVERLQGVAGKDACTRVRCTQGSVVVKSTAGAREGAFYEQHAARLRQQGVHIPGLLWSSIDARTTTWLILEDIPHAFPQERWVGDKSQLEVLFHLHNATWKERRPVVDDAYIPVWDDHMTELALDWFARSTGAGEIRAQLIEAQHAFAALPPRDCCISGDPNPTNWRVRDDGTLVLLDWEKFGYGTPAFDLAITIPGLGTDDGSTESRVAAKYLELWNETGNLFPYDQPTVVRWIQVAKLFTLVDVIATASRSPDAHSMKTVQCIVQHLPERLRQLTTAD